MAGWLTVGTPLSILIGKAPPDYFLSLIALLFLVEKIRTRDFGWARQPWFLVLFAMWSFGIVRTAFVGLSPDAFGWIRFGLFAAALGEWILPHEIWRKRMAWTAIGVTSFLACDALLQFYTGFDVIGRPQLGDRLTSIFRMPKVGLNLAWFFVPLMAWLWSQKRIWAATGYGVLCFAAILLSGDRFALLYTLSVLGLLTLFVGHLRRPALWGWVGLLGIVGLLMAFFPDVRARQFDSIITTITHFSETHYGLIWKSAWTIFQDNPLWGVGISQYRTVCSDPAYGPIYGGPLGDLSRCVMHPHNLYLEWMVALGSIGLVGLVGFVAALGHALIRKSQEQSTQAVLLALLMTLAMRFFPFASSVSFYIAWAAMPLWLYLGWALAIANKKGG